MSQVEVAEFALEVGDVVDDGLTHQIWLEAEQLQEEF